MRCLFAHRTLFDIDFTSINVTYYVITPSLSIDFSSIIFKMRSLIAVTTILATLGSISPYRIESFNNSG